MRSAAWLVLATVACAPQAFAAADRGPTPTSGAPAASPRPLEARAPDRDVMQPAEGLPIAGSARLRQDGEEMTPRRLLPQPQPQPPPTQPQRPVPSVAGARGARVDEALESLGPALETPRVSPACTFSRFAPDAPRTEQSCKRQEPAAAAGRITRSAPTPPTPHPPRLPQWVPEGVIPLPGSFLDLPPIRRGLMKAGWITLGALYVATLLGAGVATGFRACSTCDSYRNAGPVMGSLLVPGVGPFITMRFAKSEDEYVSLAVLGGLQMAGLVMGIVGTLQHLSDKGRVRATLRGLSLPGGWVVSPGIVGSLSAAPGLMLTRDL